MFDHGGGKDKQKQGSSHSQDREHVHKYTDPSQILPQISLGCVLPVLSDRTMHTPQRQQTALLNCYLIWALQQHSGSPPQNQCRAVRSAVETHQKSSLQENQHPNLCCEINRESITKRGKTRTTKANKGTEERGIKDR